MSIDIRDWDSIRNIITNQIELRLVGQEMDISEQIGLKIINLFLVSCLEQPTIVLKSFSDVLPSNFAEAIPPESTETALPPLLISVHTDFSLPEGFGMQSALIINTPIKEFAEFDCSMTISKFNFNGDLLIGICNGHLLLGIGSVNHFDIDFSTLLGDKNAKQLKPAQLDKFFIEKAHQAINLLSVRPFVTEMPTIAGVRHS